MQLKNDWTGVTRFLVSLSILALLTTQVNAQDWVIYTTEKVNLQPSKGGPSFPTQRDVQLVVLGEDPDGLVVRPLVYIHKDFITDEGVVTANDVNLRVGTYAGKDSPVIASVSKGTRLTRLLEPGDWVTAYYPSLGPYWLSHSHTLREHFPVQGLEDVTAEELSVDRRLLNSLAQLRGDHDRRGMSFLCLPTAVPAGYRASIAEFSNDSRFGPSYTVRYQKGESWFEVDATCGGIGGGYGGDLKDSFTVNSQAVGEVRMMLITYSDPGPFESVWRAEWNALPGVWTEHGDRWRGFFWKPSFSSDFERSQIEKIVKSVKAIKLGP